MALINGPDTMIGVRVTLDRLGLLTVGVILGEGGIVEKLQHSGGGRLRGLRNSSGGYAIPVRRSTSEYFGCCDSPFNKSPLGDIT